MKLKKLWVLSLVLIILFSAGCTTQDAQETSTDDTTGADTEETVVSGRLKDSLTAEEEQLLARSTYSVANNNYRLKKVIEKLQAGEEVTVAFIGGSITEGYNAGTTEIYARLVSTYLAETYGNGSNVNYVNAGLSGTPSMLGLIRCDRDILAEEPDLIFIEFAVNDGQSVTDQIAYEGLVRKCLLSEKEPAVMLLFSVIESGYTCESTMGPIGFYYKLPAVSVNNVLSVEFENGNLSWDDWSNDESHPNAYGQSLYARMIEYNIDILAERETDEPFEVPAVCKMKKDWSGVTMYDNTNAGAGFSEQWSASSPHAAFQNGWTHTGDEAYAGIADEGLTMNFTGSTLFVVYKTVSSGNYGTAEVLVDGEIVTHLAGKTSDGWNNPTTQLVWQGDAGGEHTLTIRMQEGDETTYFDVLCIGSN